VSEINPAEVADIANADVAGRGTRVLPERFREEFTELFTPPIESRRSPDREGLPPGYRMRADAHYVDQLSSRSADTTVRFIATQEIDAPTPDSADLARLTGSCSRCSCGARAADTRSLQAGGGSRPRARRAWPRCRASSIT